MKRMLLATCLCLFAGLAFAADSAGTPYEAQPVCPKAAEKARAANVESDTAAVAPAPTPSAVRVRGGGGVSAANKSMSPRWHSLLPGMFR
jgi:hypothetical protein